jgi:hypothetical protein
MMMQWGCDLADQLALPAWIEASEDGKQLYKMYGFYEYERLTNVVERLNMKRDARCELASGGK